MYTLILEQILCQCNQIDINEIYAEKEILFGAHYVTLQLFNCLILVQKEKAPCITRPLILDGGKTHQ